MKLERKELVKIIEEQNIDTRKNRLMLYIDILNNLEKLLLKYDYDKDPRFVTFCRRDFLLEELEKSLKTKDFDIAFNDIADYVRNDTWISIGSVPKEYNFKVVLKMDEEYKKAGIICEQEKDILLDMLRKFKNKCNEGDVYMQELEKRVEEIEKRNKRVELDKAWETSWTRRIGICVLTYIVVILYSYIVRNYDNIFFSSLVPVIGFTLSTLSLRYVRKIWQKNKN